MKTPMQEVYENFNLMSDADFKAWMLNTDLLEKEEDYLQRMREIVAQELHNLGMLTDRAIDQAAFESDYGYSSTNYNSFKEGVKWLEGQLTECCKQFKTKENE